jgi:hypothetical protein
MTSQNHMASSNLRRASKLAVTLFILSFLPSILAINPSELPINNLRRRSGSPDRPAFWGPPRKRDTNAPLVISNNCAENIWPGIGTQAGTGPGQGGFLLEPGTSQHLSVSADWQGRVWGRTNCSFNVGGTGASPIGGNNGGGAACDTGDCNGVLNCVVTVSSLLQAQRTRH